MHTHKRNSNLEPTAFLEVLVKLKELNKSIETNFFVCHKTFLCFLSLRLLFNCNCCCEIRDRVFLIPLALGERYEDRNTGNETANQP